MAGAGRPAERRLRGAPAAHGQRRPRGVLRASRGSRASRNGWPAPRDIRGRSKARAVPCRHGDLPRLRQSAPFAGPQPQSVGRLFSGASGSRQVALRLPCGRQRRDVLLASTPGAQLEAAHADVGIQRRHQCDGLAAPHRRRLRRGHGSRSAGPGRASAGRLPRGAHRHPSRVPLHRHAGRAGGLSGSRRTAHVSRRQRLLLAHRLRPGRSGGDRSAPRRGRHALVDRRAGRVLPRLQRRIRRPVAALGKAAEPFGRRWLRGPGLRRRHLLPAASGSAGRARGVHHGWRRGARRNRRRSRFPGRRRGRRRDRPLGFCSRLAGACRRSRVV